MIGHLSNAEIETMLRRHRVGRIACSANDRPYVVPITYVYDAGLVYAYSVQGRKIDVMREQPLVCFEIDEVETASSWRSVVAEGVFEELDDGPERSHALRRLVGREHPVPIAVCAPAAGLDRAIVFRIRLTEKSGRFERRDA
ncbi:MAG TPA: pyridoxamine 5'-phosphate oxidase family protein [Thermomicrobiales bacterium]|nr:pyridoxamine 5'-phosphate oxidase family protein [Thermomicrobiales bacterium]